MLSGCELYITRLMMMPASPIPAWALGGDDDFCLTILYYWRRLPGPARPAAVILEMRERRPAGSAGFRMQAYGR